MLQSLLFRIENLQIDARKINTLIYTAKEMRSGTKLEASQRVPIWILHMHGAPRPAETQTLAQAMNKMCWKIRLALELWKSLQR